jgi:hypothetical protein
MLITMETRLDDATIEEFLGVYRDSFAPLEDKAAARQSLTDDEFREEMLEESVLKFVAWDKRGRPAALAFVATDLSIVPWVSVPYYAARFPDHFSRGAVYYFGALLVRTDLRGGIAAAELLKELTRFVSINRGIAAFDCCRYNEETINVPELVAAGGRQICEIDTQEIDAQRYYAYTPGELPVGYSTEPLPSISEVIDLTAAEAAEKEEAVIDLVALEKEEAKEDALSSKKDRSHS